MSPLNASLLWKLSGWRSPRCHWFFEYFSVEFSLTAKKFSFVTLRLHVVLYAVNSYRPHIAHSHSNYRYSDAFWLASIFSVAKRWWFFLNLLSFYARVFLGILRLNFIVRHYAAIWNATLTILMSRKSTSMWLSTHLSGGPARKKLTSCRQPRSFTYH